jgi:hypothetical protein
MREHEDREVMHYLRKVKSDQDLSLLVFFRRSLLHRMFPHVAQKYPLVLQFKDKNGKDQLLNLSNREEGPWRVPVVARS